jgi:hypothetical protein
MAKNKLEGVDLVMRGGGYYSAATQGARDVVDNATPLVLETVDRLHLTLGSQPLPCIGSAARLVT